MTKFCCPFCWRHSLLSCLKGKFPPLTFRGTIDRRRWEEYILCLMCEFYLHSGMFIYRFNTETAFCATQNSDNLFNSESLLWWILYKYSLVWSSSNPASVFINLHFPKTAEASNVNCVKKSELCTCVLKVFCGIVNVVQSVCMEKWTFTNKMLSNWT